MNVIRVLRLPAVAACLAAILCGQTSIDLRTQSRNVDFSSAVSTKPVKAGTTLPTICSVGELYYRTDAPAGQNLYGCTATNLWTLLGGGAPASHSDQHKHGGSDEVATATPSANAIPKAGASGKLASGWFDVQGTGAKFQMFGGGTAAAEDCAKFDANGNVVSAGGPCGTAGNAYAATFSSATTWVVSGAAHGLGTCDLVASLYEANGTLWTAVQPDSVRCESAAGANQYNVTVTWSTPQAGRLVLVKGGGSGGGGGAASWGSITGTLSAQADLQSALDAKESTANKNAASGYAGLTASGKLEMAQGQEVWALADLTDVSGRRGNSTQVQMAAGTFASDDCAKFDAGGNLVSAGGPCGAGGGGSVQGGVGIYVTTGNTVNADPSVFSTLTTTSSIDFAAIANATCAHSNITLPGASTGDTAMAGAPSALTDGMFATARVTAADTVRLTVCNLSGSSQDPPNLTFRVSVTKPF